MSLMQLGRFYQPGTLQLRCPGEPPEWMPLDVKQSGSDPSGLICGAFRSLRFLGNVMMLAPSTVKHKTTQ